MRVEFAQRALINLVSFAGSRHDNNNAENLIIDDLMFKKLLPHAR